MPQKLLEPYLAAIVEGKRNTGIPLQRHGTTRKGDESSAISLGGQTRPLNRKISRRLKAFELKRKVGEKVVGDHGRRAVEVGDI